MFGRMQTLPIRYFDTHTHGDLMSHFTNDADTLRQMISASASRRCRLLGHDGGRRCSSPCWLTNACG